MANKLMVFAIATLSITNSYSQDVSTVKPKEVKLAYNAFGTPSISIDFILDMGTDHIDPDFWLTPANKPKFELKYGDQAAQACALNAQPSVSKMGFGLRLTGFNQATLNRFLAKDKDNQITIAFTADVVIELDLKPGETVARRWLIKKEDANQMIADDLEITDDKRTAFLTILNNFFYYENFVDFGIEPATDTSQSRYFLTLRFQNVYSRKNMLDCKKTRVRNPLYWSVESRLSTDFKDSLNFINIYPVNFHYEQLTEKFPFQFNARLGHESDQSFSTKRFAVNAAFNFMIPNLINLTTAKSNRLRLKPVIETGLKGYHDYSTKDSSFTSGQAFLNGYYYIPVFTNYAIIIEGKTFYDFSEENNPDKKIKGNYSITLGAEIPKTGFKAMFKYVDGKSDVNFKQGKIITLGLLIDFFQEKNSSKSPSM
jgi:hypothetical protein